MQGFARSTSYIPSQVSFTTTGNIDNLDFVGADLIRMNNATDATIRGLVAGSPGQRVTIVSIGAGHVFLAHQNTNSTIANRLLNLATSGVTPLAAGTGSATYQYDGTTARWRLIAHDQGAWITPTFAAGTFTANASMTWTVGAGDVISHAYHLRGKTLTFVVRVFTTTVGGTLSDQLVVTLPNSYTCVAGVFFMGRINDNGTPVTAIIRSTAGGTTVFASRLDGANVAAATDATAVDFNVIFEVT